ncbi:MAG: transposase [Phycisphaera sp.]|nr:transposase [Phycisphaera sp.]
MSTQSTYPSAVREQAVSKVLDAGMTFAEAAAEMDVPKALLHHWVEEVIDEMARGEKAHGDKAHASTPPMATPKTRAARSSRSDDEDDDYKLVDDAGPPDGSASDTVHVESHAPHAAPHPHGGGLDETSELSLDDIGAGWDDVDVEPPHVLDDAAPPPHRKPPENAVVKFRCEHCGRKLKTDGHHMGRQITCVSCNEHVIAPADASDPRVYFYQTDPPRLTPRA